MRRNTENKSAYYEWSGMIDNIPCYYRAPAPPEPTPESNKWISNYDLTIYLLSFATLGTIIFTGCYQYSQAL